MQVQHIKNSANIKYKQKSINDSINGIYYTHDNGGKPYKIIVNENKIEVYDNYLDKELITEYIDYEKIWIGESPKNKMTEFSGGYGINFLGNSFLIKIENNSYIHIGCEIFSFYTEEEILEYISPVGNNDVPYPYAIDKKNNYYLMLEYIILKIDEDSIEDPYEYHYNRMLNKNILQNLLGILGYMCYEDSNPLVNILVNNVIKDEICWNDLGNIKKIAIELGYNENSWNNWLKYKKSNKDKNDIDKFLYEIYYLNSKEYFYLNYQKNSKEHYNCPWMKNLHIIDKETGIEIPISEEEYIELNNKIADYYQIKELDHNLIKKRY